VALGLPLHQARLARLVQQEDLRLQVLLLGLAVVLPLLAPPTSLSLEEG
jgi:hypothetical protein